MKGSHHFLTLSQKRRLERVRVEQQQIRFLPDGDGARKLGANRAPLGLPRFTSR